MFNYSGNQTLWRGGFGRTAARNGLIPGGVEDEDFMNSYIGE